MNNSHLYDVALSFAGEDRAYVEKCADILTTLGIKVFYDLYEEDELWGEDLYSLLRERYYNQSKYILIFLSEFYTSKIWTQHEMKFIKSRMLENPDCNDVLLVKLDESLLPDIPSYIGYVSNKSPIEIATLFARKINKSIDIDLMLEELRSHLPYYEIIVDNTKVLFKCEQENFEASHPLSFLMELYKLGQIYELFICPSIVPN